MTDDDKLIETISQAINYVWLQKEARDRLAESIITDLRAAGWLLIPPLDSPDGRDAVARATNDWLRPATFADEDEAQAIFNRLFGKMSAALRAAGGSNE